jgi:hypothetical protein
MYADFTGDLRRQSSRFGLHRGLLATRLVQVGLPPGGPAGCAAWPLGCAGTAGGCPRCPGGSGALSRPFLRHGLPLRASARHAWLTLPAARPGCRRASPVPTVVMPVRSGRLRVVEVPGHEPARGQWQNLTQLVQSARGLTAAGGRGLTGARARWSTPHGLGEVSGCPSRRGHCAAMNMRAAGPDARHGVRRHAVQRNAPCNGAGLRSSLPRCMPERTQSPAPRRRPQDGVRIFMLVAPGRAGKH